jgi:hypothetical protein
MTLKNIKMGVRVWPLLEMIAMSADCITKITEKVGCVAGKLQRQGQNCVTLCCPLGKCVKGITPRNVSENDCSRNDIQCCVPAQSIERSKTIYMYCLTITETMRTVSRIVSN